LLNPPKDIINVTSITNITTAIEISFQLFTRRAVVSFSICHQTQTAMGRDEILVMVNGKLEALPPPWDALNVEF